MLTVANERKGSEMAKNDAICKKNPYCVNYFDRVQFQIGLQCGLDFGTALTIRFHMEIISICRTSSIFICSHKIWV